MADKGCSDCGVIYAGPIGHVGPLCPGCERRDWLETRNEHLEAIEVAMKQGDDESHMLLVCGGTRERVSACMNNIFDLIRKGMKDNG